MNETRLFARAAPDPRELPTTVAAAIDQSDLLAFIVDEAGNVSGVSGGFTPIDARGGTLLEALGSEALNTALMDAFVGAIALGATATAMFSLGGVRCQALCCPLAGAPVRALVVIAPDYTASGSDVTPARVGGGTDVAAALVDWRDPLALLPGGKELFIWTGSAPLTVACTREAILRILDQMLEAPLAAHDLGGTSVLTARQVMDGEEPEVELRMRTYTEPVADSIVRALEAIYAELGAACGIPIFLDADERRLDVVARLPIRRRLERVVASRDSVDPDAQLLRPIRLAR